MKKDSHVLTDIILGIRIGGFKARLFGYFLVLIPTVIVYIFAVLLPTKFFGGLLDFSNNPPENIITATFAIILIFSPVIFIFIFWERSIRKFRRAHGLNIYKNVAVEMEQIEINERVAKEHKAYVNNGLTKETLVVDKSDIRYWFGLLKDGAITQEEYDVKKKELV